MQVRRLSFPIGAEVTGLDITRPLSGADREELVRHWHEHLILLFRGQPLTPQQHIAFTRNFGEADTHEANPDFRLPGYPEAIEVTNRTVHGKPSATREVGRAWHSDMEHTILPLKGSLLWCGELPGVGGDTMFANMYEAYESLSPGMRAMLESLEAEHDVIASFSDKYVAPDPAHVARLRLTAPPVAHPVLRVHPETGRKSLFLSERVRRFIGFTDAESAPLLRYLCEHATQPEFVYRHQWQLHDALLWDNRCVIHQALADYDRSQVRYMRRTSIVGEPCGRPAPQAAA
ncbi:TauD/TfdA dioxygenase family protein [Xenophilus azovorans]|uniref:TauD/TfdA dioxygenase family protein n=1 Tax=Xenophilus azovorans TaxID=151755 RepID=UPI00057041F8|nr:TauD/TfdA family dioxygenase [Xenophilus azovorans]